MAAIDARDLENAAFLSAAAYQTSAASLGAYLSGSFWQGGVGEFFEFNEIVGPFPGFPGRTGGAFFIESNDHTTLAISFRGSDSGPNFPPFADDYFYAGLYQKLYYDMFKPFISDIRNYLASHPTINKLLVTGHSLGGAMAEIYITEDAFAIDHPILITFGSPGVNANARGPLDVTAIASNVLHLQHTGDLVPGLGGAVHGPIVNIDLPDVTDGSFNILHPEELFNITEHGKATYNASMTLIAASGLASQFLANPSAYRVVIDGSNQDGLDLFGTNSRDFIIGYQTDEISAYGGDDLIDAGDHDDTIRGGSGNDIIDGGDGIDTAVFQLTSDHYIIKRHGSQITVAGKFSIDQAADGTDTLTNIENLRFLNGTIAVASLLDLSAGTSAGGTPSDGGVTPLGGGTGGTEATTSGANTGATIVGNGTSEYLNGTSGPDTIRGNGGDDVLTGFGGQDTFDGGPGSDTVDYSYEPANVSGTIDLAAGTAMFPGFYTEQLTSIENVWMGAGNDHVFGDAGNNDLRGGPGDDVLKGGSGNDIIYGDWKYSDQGGNDTAIVSYTYGAGYTVSGSAKALHIVGAEGDDWYYEVENFQFAGGVTKTAAEILSSPSWTQTITRVSVATDGTQANGSSYPGFVSADGRYVTFSSDASNLVADDTNASTDVFIKDLQTGILIRASVGTGGTQANSASFGGSISADGRYVAFSSAASNLVPDDTNNLSDVFVKDLQTGVLTRVTLQNGGWGANPSISGDGQYVAFNSLVSKGNNQYDLDIWEYNLATHDAERVSVANDGTQANSTSSSPVISADGRYVAFWTDASNLVPNDTNGSITASAGRDVFVHDRITHRTERVSVASDGTQADNESEFVSISADGRFVSFASQASNLIPNISYHAQDVYVYDRIKRTIEQVSISSDGVPSSFIAGGNASVLSADGRFVAFVSHSPFLIAEGDQNGVAPDILLHDGLAHTTTRISVTSDGTQGNGSQHFNTYGPSITADGHYVAFGSDASNLVSGDTNNATDIFIVNAFNTVPIARADSLTTNDDSAINGNVLVDNSHGADSDPDGDSLTIVAINGVAANVGRTITLASGALLVVNPDGRFVYDSNGQLDNLISLTVGNYANDSFTYTISDSQGHTATASVNLTINGTVHGLNITGGLGTIEGTSADDQIAGGITNETIHGRGGYDWLQGGAGNDTLDGGPGNDTLDGGTGTNTAVYSGRHSDYLVTKLSASSLQISDTRAGSPDGSDMVSNVQNFQFADHTYTFGQVSAGHVFAALNVPVAAFNPANGWTSDDQYPRRMADVNGDGMADIVGFGIPGVRVALATGGGNFAASEIKLSAFNPANGWISDDTFHRELADVNGDGMADIVGFGIAGVRVALATGGGNFATPEVKLAAFNPANGWTSDDAYHRELADVNGDGMADIIGFGIPGVMVALATGGGNFATPQVKLAAFNPANGWTSQDAFHRELADVNGDGMADIVGFGNGGVYVALATGGGNFAPFNIDIKAFNPANGWTSDNQFHRQLADVNHDGMADIVGFGNGGVYVAAATGGGHFAAPIIDIPSFNPANGWTSQDAFYREVADVNGDGSADIVGFGNPGVLVALANDFHLI